MTLSQTVLFPQAMMPLFIFEPRYREMLSTVLEEDRIFAVAALDERNEHAEVLETPYSIAGVGVVRACKQNPDGTSNLILQGLARVQFENFVCEEPYRRARIQQLMSESDGSEETLGSIQPTLLALVQIQMRLGADIPQEVLAVSIQYQRAGERARSCDLYTMSVGKFQARLARNSGYFVPLWQV